MSSIFGRLTNLAKGAVLVRDQADVVDPEVEAELSASRPRRARPTAMRAPTLPAAEPPAADDGGEPTAARKPRTRTL